MIRKIDTKSNIVIEFDFISESIDQRIQKLDETIYNSIKLLRILIYRNTHEHIYITTASRTWNIYYLNGLSGTETILV